MSIKKFDSQYSRKDYYTIGDIAKIYNIGVDAIRYYEEKGLIFPARGENRYRYYNSHTIWRMNTILNLRSLGFSVERVREYFEHRTVEQTELLLEEELQTIQKKLDELSALRSVVDEQLSTIRMAKQLPFEIPRSVSFPDRRAFFIYSPHSSDDDMDLLMARLSTQSNGKLYMIGNNRMASLIAAENEESIYDGGIIFDQQGDFCIPAGKYLSLCYRGPTDSRRKLAALKDFAASEGIQLSPPYLDLVWLDVHSSENEEEFVSEIQARVCE